MRFKARRGSEAQRLQGEGVVGKCVKAAAGSAEGMKQNLGWGQRSKCLLWVQRTLRALSLFLGAASR